MAGTAQTRIGLVGFGFGGRTFHAPLIASAAGATLAGVVTRSPERRAEVAAHHPGVPVFDDLAQLAAAGADAVAISTPVTTHLDLVDEAVELGLAVVCDKPFALEASTAEASLQRAEAAGVPLTIYQNRRWDGDFLTARRLAEAGTLGRVTRFESRFERFQPGADDGPPVSGGGLLRDFGAHLVDQALHLLGPVTEVFAQASLPADPNDLSVLEDRFFLVLTHAGGAVSHLGGDWVQPAPGPRFRVSGTEGGYVIAALMDGQEDALIAGRTPASEGDNWGEEKPSSWGWLQRGASREPVPTDRGRWDTFYPAFAAAVRGEGPLPVDPWDTVAAMKVLDAARLSATIHQVVTL